MIHFSENQSLILEYLVSSLVQFLFINNLYLERDSYIERLILTFTATY